MEQAVIVHLRLAEDAFGSTQEREAVALLAETLDRVINEQDVGEFDGEEFGAGRCVLYMYGPDADRLFSVVEPILNAAPMVKGGLAIKRYGEAKDAGATEVRINL